MFAEIMFAIRQAQAHIERLEQAIGAAVPEWSLAEMVTAFMAFRGIDLVSSDVLTGRARRSDAPSNCHQK